MLKVTKSPPPPWQFYAVLRKGVTIWWKTCLHNSSRGQLKIVGKTCPFREIPQGDKNSGGLNPTPGGQTRCAVLSLPVQPIADRMAKNLSS